MIKKFNEYIKETSNVNELDGRFEKIITKLQKLRKKHSYDFEEECKEEINKAGQEIMDNNLISKSNNKHWAKQLCIMNNIPEKFWSCNIL